jgi:hypothetical protein
MMISVSQALATAAVVAEDIDPDSRESLIDGALPIAGLFVLVLLVAMFFLWRSMSKQMKKIDPSLPDGPDDREQARDRAVTREAVERGEAADPDDVAR